MATIKFLIQSKTDTAGIYVRLKEGRLIDVKAKTKFIIDSEDWSHVKGQPKNLKDEGLKSINSELTSFKSKLLKHYNNTPNKLEINTQWLKDFINPPPAKVEITTELVPYFVYYAQSKKNDLSTGTYKKLHVIKHLLERFQEFTKSHYLVKDVDLRFKKSFEDYCLLQNYAPNTIARSIKFIKTVCFHANLNNIEVSNQLNNVTAKFHSVDSIYLTPEDLKAIEAAEIESESLINVRDWLLISCETGQRISDFMRFTKAMIRYEKNKKGIAKPLIEFTQTKTKKIMTVPLSKKVMAILKKRKGEFPYAISDQKYNDYIKDVCNIAEIHYIVKGAKLKTIDGETRKEEGIFPKWQLVTSHIGRRSFATNNYGRVPTSLLIGITGHSTEKQFLEYIGKTDTQKALQAAEYF